MLVLANYSSLDDRIQAIKTELQNNQSKMHDEDTVLGNIRFDAKQSKYLYFREGSTWEDRIDLANHAETQLLSRLGIPASYIQKCPSALKETNINYWINNFSNKPIMLRWKENIIRAIFSTRYSTDLDDYISFPVVLDSLYQLNNNPDENLHLKDFWQDIDVTILNSLFKNTTVTHNGHIYIAGVTVINSEVGASSVCIRPTIRLGTSAFGTNLKFVSDLYDSNRDGVTNIRHIGLLNVENVQGYIQKAYRVASIGIHRLMQTQNEIVEDAVQETKDLVERSNFLSKRLIHIIEEEYQEEKRINKLVFAQSILNAVKELPIFRRHLAQREVGRYLDLFRDSEVRFKNTVNDIEESNQLAE